MKIERKDEPDTFKPFDIVVHIDTQDEKEKLMRFMSLTVTVPRAATGGSEDAEQRKFIKDFMNDMHIKLRG